MKKNTKFLFTRICFFIIAILTTSCTAYATKKLNPPNENFVKIFTTVELTMCDKKTKKCASSTFRSTGSGLIMYIVNDRVTALTAGHVCNPGLEMIKNKISNLSDFDYRFSVTVQALNHKDNLYNSQVILSENMKDSDVSGDLCLIEILSYNESFKKIIFSRKAPVVGEEVYYMGSPGGVFHPPVVPIFKGIFSGDIDKRTAMATLPASGGSSGGVVMSLNNKIYGVLFATHYNLPSISLTSTYPNTKKFLKRAKLLLIEHQGTSIRFQSDGTLHTPYMP